VEQKYSARHEVRNWALRESRCQWAGGSIAPPGLFRQGLSGVCQGWNTSRAVVWSFCFSRVCWATVLAGL